jgi:hypothetical protein
VNYSFKNTANLQRKMVPCDNTIPLSLFVHFSFDEILTWLLWIFSYTPHLNLSNHLPATGYEIFEKHTGSDCTTTTVTTKMIAAIVFNGIISQNIHESEFLSIEIVALVMTVLNIYGITIKCFKYILSYTL